MGLLLTGGREKREGKTEGRGGEEEGK